MTVAGDLCGWPEHETKSRLSSVFSRAEAAARGERIEYLGGHRDPRYRYNDSTLVEMLAITEDEMRSGIISSSAEVPVKIAIECARPSRENFVTIRGSMLHDAPMQGALALSTNEIWQIGTFLARRWQDAKGRQLQETA